MKIFQKARWLSLDITMGAVVLLFFISRIHGIETSWHIYLALAIAIWTIYTLDHLNDVRKVDKPRLATGRHSYHRHHFKSIMTALGLVLIIGIVNIYFLPYKLIAAGLIFILFSIVYLLIQGRLATAGLKEFTIAVGYAIGVFMYPVIAIENSGLLVFQAFQLFLLALMNLVLMAFYDTKYDKEAGFASIVGLGSERIVRVLVRILAGTVLLSFAVYWLIYHFDFYQIFVLAAVVMLTIIYEFPSIFSSDDRFRLWADAVFFIPLLILPFL
jgi:hypothetical protein